MGTPTAFLFGLVALLAGLAIGAMACSSAVHADGSTTSPTTTTTTTTTTTSSSSSVQTTDAAASSDPAPDKSGYNLFNPTPDDEMRKFTPDRPAKGFSVRTIDAGHFELETDIVNYTTSNDRGSAPQRRATARRGCTRTPPHTVSVRAAECSGAKDYDPPGISVFTRRRN